MAICLIKKGGGGIQSEDTTAVRADVLVGKTALTADSNDEAAEGTMQLLSANSDISLSVMFAHNRSDQWGEGGAIDSPSKGRGIIIAIRPEDGKKYALNNSVAFVFMPASDLRPENIRADKTIAKVKGAIPVWSVVGSGFLDMLYAWADQGHAIDHPVAGRGLVVRIPNGYLIEGANWVFLKAPTLLPENIRQGIDVLGIQGTLPDYGAGGVPFNGATFDNRLISGVADKGKEIQVNGVNATGNTTFPGTGNFTNWNIGGFKFLGIRDGGIRFSVSDSNNQGVNKASIATFFDRSINLTPFRKVRVGAKFLSGSYKKYSSQNDRAVAWMGVVFVNKNNLIHSNNAQYKYQAVLNANYKGRHISFIDGAEHEEVNDQGRLTGQQLWAEVDVSDINEHCFAFAYARANAGYYYAAAEMIINHIEFIN